MESPLSGVQRSMLWFRKGLRLHDNPALIAASKAVYMAPVFVLDPWFLVPQKVGVNRLNFLLESLTGRRGLYRLNVFLDLSSMTTYAGT